MFLPALIFAFLKFIPAIGMYFIYNGTIFSTNINEGITTLLILEIFLTILISWLGYKYFNVNHPSDVKDFSGLKADAITTENNDKTRPIKVANFLFFVVSLYILSLIDAIVDVSILLYGWAIISSIGYFVLSGLECAATITIIPENYITCEKCGKLSRKGNEQIQCYDITANYDFRENLVGTVQSDDKTIAKFYEKEKYLTGHTEHYKHTLIHVCPYCKHTMKKEWTSQLETY